MQQRELWRDLAGKWVYALLTRDSVIKVKLTDADRMYLDRFPDRIKRFI